jgi:hypothetical protein
MMPVRPYLHTRIFPMIWYAPWYMKNRTLIPAEILRSCQVLWRFMNQPDVPTEIEILVVLGSTDLVVPAFAATLAQHYKPKLIVCSGGLAHQDDLLNTGWDEPEAVIFKKVLTGFGIAPEPLVEDRSLNTGENIRNSLDVIRECKADLRGICFVHKPYMTLRTRLTCKMSLADEQFTVTGPNFSFEEYHSLFANAEHLISVMVGDFQRIRLYPDKGYSARCEIPAEAAEAFDSLTASGYSRHLLRGP